MPDFTTDYAEKVLSGRILAGRPVRLACQRHIDDLVNGHKRGLTWDPESGAWVDEFFSKVLHLSGGEYEGLPFHLHQSQRFIVGSLFGWKGPDGHRRFRVAYVEQGKGAGKSPLGAGIGLYMMTADGEPRAECYAAAVDKNQATIPFAHAVSMCEQSPLLQSRIRSSGGSERVWRLDYLKNHSFFRPISSEHRGGRGKSGPSVHYALLDEIHEHPSDVMVEFMRAGTKTRRQALILMITNSGFDRNSVSRRYHEYGLRVLEAAAAGDHIDDSFFPYICSLDACEICAAEGYKQPRENCVDCDDWRDEAVWSKVNPLLDVGVPKRKYLAEQVREAEGMPSKRALVMRLNFCLWTESQEVWIGPDLWRENAGEVDVRELAGKPCVGGLDLSSKNDLTSLTLAFEGDEISILPFFWTPSEGLLQREKNDGAPYHLWSTEGHLQQVPGSTIDYGWVAEKLGELSGIYRLGSVAFDPWRIDDLRRELDARGVKIELVPHGQGFKDMHPAIEATEDALKQKKIQHGNHPVLYWCVSNVKTVQNSQGFRIFNKRRSGGRIDGAVTLAMAVRMLTYGAPEPKRLVHMEEGFTF